jgi:uracil-DNA glycosylase family 4
MSERETREELAGIARSLRLRLRREGLTGGAELLLRSASVVRREGRVPKPPVAAPAATAAPSVVREPAAPPVVRGTAVAPQPAATAAVAATVAVNLFGEPEPVKPSYEPLDLSLPSHHDPLFPIEAAARDQVYAASLPVLETVATEVRACRKCGLCETRTNAVPGVGSARTGIVFVGEAPGADEDAKGEPFVGRAGQLLTQIIKAMDEKQLIPGVPLNQETVYICNVLKCRPPENRNPLPHEIEQCSPYLHRQLEAIQPRIICCLGKFAAELLIGVKGTIGGLRGKVYRWKGARLIVTYHPAACLRNPGYKRPVWEDMQLLAREYLAS